MTATQNQSPPGIDYTQALFCLLHPRMEKGSDSSVRLVVGVGLKGLEGILGLCSVLCCFSQEWARGLLSKLTRKAHTSLWLPYSQSIFCKSPASTTGLSATSQTGSSAITLAHLPVREQLLPVLGKLACQGVTGWGCELQISPVPAQPPCLRGSCPAGMTLFPLHTHPSHDHQQDASSGLLHGDPSKIAPEL